MKRTLLCALFVIGLLVVWGGSALAAPANDDFPGMTITEPTEGSPSTHSVPTTEEATDEEGEPRPCGDILATVWYNFTPSTDQIIVVDTSGSDYDTVLAAYTGPSPSPGPVSFGSLSLINCNDDFAGLQSELMLAVSADTTYYFQVGGFVGAKGNLVFTVTANGNDDGVTIDIKPGSSPNSINPDSQGVIPVAILTTTDFDAATVDPATVWFGADEASAVMHALEDVGGSEAPDLIMHFRTQETGIQSGDKKACLTGQTFGLENIEGCDTVRTVPPNTDTDGDSFSDEVESTLGTPQFVTCYKAGIYLAWPPDVNGDEVADVQDLNDIVPKLFSSPPGPPYSTRSDVYDPNGAAGPIVIDVQDLNVITPFLFVSCPSPP